MKKLNRFPLNNVEAFGKVSRKSIPAAFKEQITLGPSKWHAGGLVQFGLVFVCLLNPLKQRISETFLQSTQTDFRIRFKTQIKFFYAQSVVEMK